jgi:hypothetical protein
MRHVETWKSNILISWTSLTQAADIALSSEQCAVVEETYRKLKTSDATV